MSKVRIVPISEYDDLDAVGLAELVARGDVSPEELLAEAVQRIEQTHAQLNVVVYRDDERARRKIGDGLPAGPLRGVPLLVKETMPIADMPLTFGSVLLRDHIASETHAFVRRLEASGCVVVGRTNMGEFGLLPTTESTLFGPAHNPWSLAHSPGGSSGGSAAAVAARIVPLAHGDDGGGSIRIPAAHCGVFGLKPSRHRTPNSVRDPIGYVAGGCLTRSVRDSAVALDVLSTPDRGERVLLPPPAGSFRTAAERDPASLRIAFCTSSFGGQETHPDCVAAVQSAARLCEELGHRVEEARPAIDQGRYQEAFLVVWAMAAGQVDRLLQKRLEQISPRLFASLWRSPLVRDLAMQVLALHFGRPPLERFTRRLIAIDRRHTPGDVWIANQALRDAEYLLAKLLGEYDLLLTPTLGEPPWLIGELDLTQSDDALRARLNRYVAFTPLCNTSGYPALSVPLFWNAEGLPIGVQFVGPYAGEELLFELAGQLERARPWTDRRPPVCAG